MVRHKGTRPKKTRLEQTRLTSAYRRRLRLCWATCLDWLVASGIDWESLTSSPPAFDAVLVRYVEFCHKTHVPHYVAKHGILFAQWMYRGLHGELPRTWDALKSWHMAKPWKPRVPIAFEAIQYLFLCGLNLWTTVQRESKAFSYFVVGFLMWVAFEGLLRPGELLNLRMSDVRVLSTGGRMVVVIAIKKPKTRSHMGRVQFSIIRNEGLAKWMSWFKALVDRPEKPLWSRTATRFRATLKDMLRLLKLDKLGYTVASCRSGGATFRFMQGESVERLQFQGRWASTSSLKSYIQESMAWLCWSAIPPPLEQKIMTVIHHHAAAFREPPSNEAFWSARHGA